MRQAAFAIAACMFVVLGSAARALESADDVAAAIERARRLVDAKDYASAATLLEEHLLESGARDRTAMLGILEQAYEALAKEAEAAGRDGDLANFRADLEIIRRRRPSNAPSRPKSQDKKPPKEPGSPAAIDAAPARKPIDRPAPEAPNIVSPSPKPAAPALAIEGPAAMSEPAVMPRPAVMPEPDRAPQQAEAPPSSQPSAALPQPQPQRALPSLEEANLLFKTKKYDEAGRIYAALARENRLPRELTNHWAYCRIREVARRMNARPKSTAEWDQIEAEIESIQRLAPNLWYGEYLRNKLAEVRKGRSKAQAQSGNLVIRGSAPDDGEDQPRRFRSLFGKSQAAGLSRAAAEEAPKATPKPESSSNASATAKEATAWQVRETPNFRILHHDPRLAELAAAAAENVRAVQAKRWGSPALEKPWNPRCEIHLHSTGEAFAAATGQAETSPGFSEIGTNGGRVTTRRVILRADEPKMLEAVLPHEVTHVVLADLFADQIIPRWADEGIAVQSEPTAEQRLRAADLHEPLSAGQVIDVRQLMSSDKLDAKDWALYYAQSESLTRFLVEQGTPEQFIRFLRDAGRRGIEAALRENYRIGGFAELQQRWQAYAREQLASIR